MKINVDAFLRHALDITRHHSVWMQFNVMPGHYNYDIKHNRDIIMIINNYDIKHNRNTLMIIIMIILKDEI